MPSGTRGTTEDTGGTIRHGIMTAGISALGFMTVTTGVSHSGIHGITEAIGQDTTHGGTIITDGTVIGLRAIILTLYIRDRHTYTGQEETYTTATGTETA